MPERKKSWAIVYFSDADKSEELEKCFAGMEVKVVGTVLMQRDYVHELEKLKADYVILVDGQRLSVGMLNPIVQANMKQSWEKKVGYISSGQPGLWLGMIPRRWKEGEDITNSSVFIGEKSILLNAYGGSDLAGGVMASIGYSLQKSKGIKFCGIKEGDGSIKEWKHAKNKWNIRANYYGCLPFHYLISGEFFRQLLGTDGKVQRDMVFRMLFLLFACFTFLYMPLISRDYGVTGDEFPDHRHAGYVLDYFSKGDKASIYQPKTTLHLYGISMQVVAAAICRWFNIDNYYECRHVVCALNGALGILFVGFMGLRLGGGLSGLLAILLMFFTPRYFGHSMNNLKDIPFAVGYIISIFYTVRLFDTYPFFRLRYIIGAILGIALALGTRSGGLLLYPMLFMYAGLFYMQRYGVRDFYKVRKYFGDIVRILKVLFIIVVLSYILAIALWPFALQKPFANVLVSLESFTHYSIGLRTIFDGEQMMSNMLPWRYAPQYLMIGMPLVTVAGFLGSIVYFLWRRREFSLQFYFLFFAVVFPVFWVVYKNSNLYGGLRHLLFVLPPMVVIAAEFWRRMMMGRNRYKKYIVLFAFLGLFTLPLVHYVKNHPNEYVYFNELCGGLKGAYGNYETDYYFNSLKESCDWFKENVKLPTDRKTIIVSQLSGAVEYYLRKDTNVQVIYSRYYEKYSKDWDYAILGNVYVDRFQLQHGGFPPDGNLYAPEVDGYPMSCVVKRENKDDLRGFLLEKEQKYGEAVAVFEKYVAAYPNNPEVWARMAKLYYTLNDMENGKRSAEKALQIHPKLSEALYLSVLIDLKLKDYPGAFTAVNQMFSVNSSSIDAYYLRATVYFAMKRYQEAVNDLNKLLSIMPNYDRALLLAGDIFRTTNNYRQALEVYKNLLTTRNDVSVLVLIADCHCHLKNFEEVEKILQQVIKVQPGYFPMYKVWARMYLMRGETEKAVPLLARMSQIENDAELFVLRAMYLNATDKGKEAELMLGRALALSPENSEAFGLKQKLK